LTKQLRTRRPTRRNNANKTKGKQRSVIENAVSIHDRPAAANNRTEPGHWEGDLIIGTNGSQMGTIVDRVTGFTVLVQLDRRDSDTVCDRLSEQFSLLPVGLCCSLTWDRGMELAAHHRVTENVGLPVYFADPRSPWQRGTNENTNGLLRQYFPKKTSMHPFSQADLDAVAHRLNTRPRKRLGYQTPADRIGDQLQ
jgi:IS30 family transposase